MNMATFENMERDNDERSSGSASGRHQSANAGTSQRHDSGAAANQAEELLGAGLHYVNAQSRVLQSSLGVLKAEARLGMLRLVIGAVSVVAATVLLLVSWVLLMIGVAESLTLWLTTPGANVVVLAALNLALAVACYLFGRNLLRKLAGTRPFAGVSA